MTVSYSADFATDSFSIFIKILWKWRGSVYQLTWKPILVFTMFYILLYITFAKILSHETQHFFVEVAEKAEKTEGILIGSLAFVLGFYINVVLSRWWTFYLKIPYPDSLSFMVTAYIPGEDNKSRLLRRTLMRYVNLSLICVFRHISVPVKKRFPTLDHLVVSGIMTDAEKELLQKTQPAINMYATVLLWSIALINKAQSSGFIPHPMGCSILINEVKMFRSGLGKLLSQDLINIPLVYTQVVMVAVYAFCAVCLFARQTYMFRAIYMDEVVFASATNESYTNNKNNTLLAITTSGNVGKINDKLRDVSGPFRTLLHYLFYIGCLKAAEVCLNPMGEDDDDFPTNWIIDRNLSVTYNLLDMQQACMCPTLEKDKFWEKAEGEVLIPYTNAAKKFDKGKVFEGSAAQVCENKPREIFEEPMALPIIKGHDIKNSTKKLRLRKNDNVIEPVRIPTSPIPLHISSSHKNDPTSLTDPLYIRPGSSPSHEMEIILPHYNNDSDKNQRDECEEDYIFRFS